MLIFATYPLAEREATTEEECRHDYAAYEGKKAPGNPQGDLTWTSLRCVASGSGFRLDALRRAGRRVRGA